LAVGHQRHYNVLYANAVDAILRGTLGDLHYVRAQWNRGNMPGNDSWQQPMPPKAKPGDRLAGELAKKRGQYQRELDRAKGSVIDVWRMRLEQVDAQLSDANEKWSVNAEKFGYEKKDITDASNKVIYQRPAIEELIRWRLWDRTSAGLMAELGSHQLDAAGIFVHAMHRADNPQAKKPHPLSVAAVANRPLFPPDRDVEDHVYCVIEFPAPGYDPKDPLARQKKIGVQYSSINGNGFGEYGEIVYGTKATLVLERELEMTIIKEGTATPSRIRVSAPASSGPTLDTQASGASSAGAKVSRGYAEELEHWAWCIRHRDPANQPRCGPAAAMADAIIALTTNSAARAGKRIEFREEWFDINNDATPEGFPPSTRGKA
jgi:predicted dehydrogenase